MFKRIYKHHVLLIEISFWVLFALWTVVIRAFTQLESGMGWFAVHPQVSLLPICARMACPSGNSGNYQFEALDLLSAKLFGFLLLMFTAYDKRHRRRDERTARQ